MKQNTRLIRNYSRKMIPYHCEICDTEFILTASFEGSKHDSIPMWRMWSEVHFNSMFLCTFLWSFKKQKDRSTIWKFDSFLPKCFTSIYRFSRGQFALSDQRMETWLKKSFCCKAESIGNPAGIGQGTGFGLRERDRDGIGLGHYRLRARPGYE